MLRPPSCMLVKLLEALSICRWQVGQRLSVCFYQQVLAAAHEAVLQWARACMAMAVATTFYVWRAQQRSSLALLAA